MRSILIALTACLCLACTKNNKVPIAQLIFNEALTEAYFNENPFDGEAWSDDNRTMCITCKNGNVVSIRVFHKNGETAIDGTSITGEGKMFDETGNSVTTTEFINQYPQLIKAIERISSSMSYGKSLE